MKMIRTLPVVTIRNFDDYHHTQAGENKFYIRVFNKHLEENKFLDKPHGHDFFVMLLITEGSGIHNIDFRSYPVKPHTVFFLSPGQVHNWELSEDVNGYILFFTKEYLLVDFNHNKLTQLPFYFSQVNEPYMVLDEEGENEMLEVFRKIDTEYHARKRFFHDMIRLNLKMLLIGLERRYLKKPLNQLMKYQENQVHKFEALIDEHFKEYRSVSKYADLMNISIKQLNTLCKKAFCKTPSDLIQERIILEAKRLLVHSDYSINAISEILNYTDSSYFIRLFKKVVHMTPEQFRVSRMRENWR